MNNHSIVSLLVL